MEKSRSLGLGKLWPDKAFVRSLSWFSRSLDVASLNCASMAFSSIEMVTSRWFVDYSGDFGAGMWSKERKCWAFMRYSPKMWEFISRGTPKGGKSSPRGELIALALLLSTFGEALTNSQIIVYVDALVCVYGHIKKGSVEENCDILLQLICTLQIHFSVNIILFQVPREQNAEADALSKGNHLEFFSLARKLLGGQDLFSNRSATKILLPSRKLWPQGQPLF